MARQFEYDESGSSTLYVVLSVLILYLVPATLSRLSALVWGSSSSTDAATDPLGEITAQGDAQGIHGAGDHAGARSSPHPARASGAAVGG